MQPYRLSPQRAQSLIAAPAHGYCCPVLGYGDAVLGRVSGNGFLFAVEQFDRQLPVIRLRIDS